MAGSNHRKTDLRTFKALDDLPPELMRGICFANTVWEADYLRDIYQREVKNRGDKATIQWLMASIEGGDEQEVQTYGARFRRSYGYALPHIAAQATIIRFRPVAERRLGKRVRKVPLQLRAAWRATERLMPKEGLDEDRALSFPLDDELAGRFGNLDVDAA
jgi:hypothetical protein